MKISKEGKTAFMLIFEMAKPSALTNLNLQIVFFAISTFDRVEEYHCGNCDSIVLFYDSSNLAQLNLVGLYIFLVKGIKNLIVFLKRLISRWVSSTKVPFHFCLPVQFENGGYSLFIICK